MLSLIVNTTARRSFITVTARNNAAPTNFSRAFFSSNTDTKTKGTVKWFDVKKGYGFLVPDDGGADVFVHHSSIHAEGFRALGEGESVEFDILEEPSGKLRAVSVTGPDGSFVQGAPKRTYNPEEY